MSPKHIKRRITFISVVLIVILIFPFVSTNSLPIGRGGNNTSSIDKSSIDGVYYYEDGVSRSSVIISGGSWSMETSFGRGGYGGESSYDHGSVRGNILYYSGLEYGRVSGNTLRIAGRTYRKR